VTNKRHWPVRPRPERDELLSSWLQKLSSENGQKLQAFCDCEFGSQRQLWNRDIDRLAPAWLLNALSRKTGLTRSIVANTTFRPYAGTIFRNRRVTGQLRWILSLQIYHRKRRGYGLQYCAQCLAEDREPYFRRRWRVAYCTFCPDHATLLHDRCFRCGSPVAFHRRELGKPLLLAAGPMSICHQCGFDLRDSPGREVPICSPDTHQRTVALLKSLELNHRTEPAFGFSFHLILHQMCKIIVSEEKTWVKKFICDQLKYEEVHFTPGRIAFELRPLPERHYATELAMWVMLDLRRRLASAWEAKAVRYNHFVRDLDQPPKELMSIVREFNFWMTI
jgi:hypothetical protein